MILIAHSNFIAQDIKQQEKMRPYPPLSTLLTAALLERSNFRVELFDATFAAGLNDFLRILEKSDPQILLLLEDNFNFLTKMCTTVRRESALAMVAAAKTRGARVAVNGPDAADNPALYLSAGADAVILGEGEEAALELVEHWSLGRDDPGVIAGIVLPDRTGTGLTRPRPAMRDPGRLPHPAWHLLDVESYRRAWTGRHGEFSWNIATSRGCPYACNWCAKPTFGRRYAVRLPADVAQEMRRLRDEIAPDHLWFTDDILGLDVDWVRNFASEVRRLDARIPFTMQSRVNLMTEATVSALAEAGAREVWLGVESGSQAILDAMDKGATVAEARTATRLLKRHGIKACWFIQLGYPSESWADLLATRDLIRTEEPEEIGVSVSYPLPGTEFHRRVRAQLGRQRNWKDTGDLAMLFQGTYSSRLYRKIRDLLHAEVTGRRPLEEAWAAIAAEAEMYRSPDPLTLAVGG